MADTSTQVEALRARFDELDARCSAIQATWPSGMAIYRGEAEITDEMRAELAPVDVERMEVLLELNRVRAALREEAAEA